MGLIRAALGATVGTLSDQWKEYFYCEALPANVLVAKGIKRNGRSGNDNIISNGSMINVADGQCMMIVESGKIVDICAEPGEYTYDTGTEPSIFVGSLKENIPALFKEMGKRFTFDGSPAKDQRIYYFNTKEIMGNKYGTPNAIPFRVVDERAGIDFDIGLRCFGEYSYRLVNPMLFYTNICGNVSNEFTREEIDSQLKSELLTALQPAFARLSDLGIRYSSVVGHTRELTEILREELSATWGDRMGIEIQTVGISSIKANEEDEAMIKELQHSAAFTDAKRAMAYDVASRGKAMRDAANNPNGAAMGMMGVNMVNGMGGASSSELLYKMEQQEAAQPKPEAPQNGWTCACGSVNTGKFCSQCGSPKPVVESWTCSCGSVNTGKFCPQCGNPKPQAVVCSNCGWKPEAGVAAGKFCPQCGTKL